MTTPFLTRFGLLWRFAQHIEMSRTDGHPIVGYQFWGHRGLNHVYGNPLDSGVGGDGPQALFQVTRGQHFRSTTLRRKGLGLYEQNRRGQTHVVFSIEDFITPGAGQPLPPDGEWLFLRVQENRLGVGLLNLGGDPADPALGPVYCVPPASFFGMESAPVTLGGIAPGNTLCAEGVVPNYNDDLSDDSPRPLHLVFPRAVSELVVRNRETVGGENLLFSLGPGQPMRELAPEEEAAFSNTSLKEVVLASSAAAAGADFSLTGVSGWA